MNTQVNEIYRLWKAWTTVFEMLVDRKYQIGDDYFMTLEAFEEWVGNDEETARKTMYDTFPQSGMKKGISIFWKELLGTSDVQEIVEAMDEADIRHAIVIHNNKVTPYAATALRCLRVQKKIIEVFSENELQYNITRHEDVPQHIICSAQTKENVFAAYSIDGTKINKMMSTEPVLRYYGASKGQLIKIVRQSDSIPEVELPASDDSGIKEKKKLYDITYKIVV